MPFRGSFLGFLGFLLPRRRSVGIPMARRRKLGACHVLQEGSNDLRVIMDESSIEVGESKKHLNVSVSLRLRPFLDRLNPNWVHDYTIRCYNEAEVFH